MSGCEASAEPLWAFDDGADVIVSWLGVPAPTITGPDVVGVSEPELNCRV
jgi:hypothetical protein